jgi:hypothetical protein
LVLVRGICIDHAASLAQTCDVRFHCSFLSAHSHSSVTSLRSDRTTGMGLASHSAEESRIRLKNARLLFLAQPFSVGGACRSYSYWA